MKQENDLYELLGVQKNATPEEIKLAFRDFAKKNHPDKFPDHPELERITEEYTEVSNAYDVLSNKEKRAHYDNTGTTGPITTFKQQFIGFVSMQLMQIIESTSMPLEGYDIMQAMLEQAKDVKRNGEKAKGVTKDKILQLQKISDKMEPQENNPFVDALQSHIQSYEKQLEAVENELALIIKIIPELRKYRYNFNDITKMIGESMSENQESQLGYTRGRRKGGGRISFTGFDAV